MSDDVYVFLGPSLPVAEAEAHLDAHYLPPVSVGDVCDLLLDRDPPFAIGIVDGLFEQVPAVWHKEILYALTRNVLVFGAASMGALRAAELHPFGMIGVGEIFTAYRDGTYTDDDEVAVAHAPAEDGFRPLSEAMANLRAGMAAACAEDVIGAAAARTMLAEAKAMFYPDRSWPATYAAGLIQGVPNAEVSALREFVARTKPNAKRADTASLLLRIRTALERGERPPETQFELEPTYYWEKLCRTVRNGRRTNVTDGPGPHGLFGYLLDREAQRIGLVVDDQPYEPGHAERALGALESRYRSEFASCRDQPTATPIESSPEARPTNRPPLSVDRKY